VEKYFIKFVLPISFTIVLFFTSIADCRDKRWIGTNNRGHFTSNHSSRHNTTPRYQTYYKTYKNVYWTSSNLKKNSSNDLKKWHMGRFKARRIR
jgi:hypothetical protein